MTNYWEQCPKVWVTRTESRDLNLISKKSTTTSNVLWVVASRPFPLKKWAQISNFPNLIQLISSIMVMMSRSWMAGINNRKQSSTTWRWPNLPCSMNSCLAVSCSYHHWQPWLPTGSGALPPLWTFVSCWSQTQIIAQLLWNLWVIFNFMICIWINIYYLQSSVWEGVLQVQNQAGCKCKAEAAPFFASNCEEGKGWWINLTSHLPSILL